METKNKEEQKLSKENNETKPEIFLESLIKQTNRG